MPWNPWTGPTFTGGVVWEDFPSKHTPEDATNLNAEENAEVMYAAAAAQSVYTQITGQLPDPASIASVGSPFAYPHDGGIIGVGDSIVANGIQTQNNENLLSAGTGQLGLVTPKSWLMWASLYSGGALKYAGTCAVGGTTTAQILANIQASLVSTAMPLKPRLAAVLAGTNDVNTNVPIATTIANLKAIYSALLAKQITPVLCTIPPHGQTDTQAQINMLIQLNRWIRRYAIVHGLPFVDMYAVLVNPANGQYQTAFTTDYLHPTEAGAQVMGAALWNVLKPLYPSNANFPTSQIDTLNLIPNGLFLTSSGGIPTGWIAGTNATPSVAAASGGAVGNAFTQTSAVHAASSFQYNSTMIVSAGDICSFAVKLLAVFTAGSTFQLEILTSPGFVTNVFGLYAWDLSTLPGGVWAGLNVDFVVPPFAPGETRIKMAGSNFNGNVGDTLSLAQISLLDLTALGIA